MNTNAFRSLSYGVYIVSTLDGNRPTGCVANSAMQITSTPATIAVSINHDNYTNSCIEKSGKFAISILSEQSDAGLIGTFGFQSGKDVDKFDGVEAVEREGISIVADACAYVVCKVIDKMETATHTVFLGEVVDADVLKGGDAMTYAYYHKVVKGKSPKNAPTYLPEESTEAPKADDSKWVCGICGYVYDGDLPFEEVPEDFVCPICKQPKSVFVKK
ncbi:MAG: flavin reductase [Faecalimonas sp.]|nr:flavin reductase [Faecalimonas sp.]